MIAFVGSVFSPYYAWAGRGDPENHVAINICLYAPGRNRWTMTERGRASLARDAVSFSVGPSALRWEDGGLTILIDEIALPRPPGQWLPRRLRGGVRVEPAAVFARSFDLDPAARHQWRPVAPVAKISVDLGEGEGAAWSGHGYLDSNWGSEPLEDGFVRWDWARGVLPGGDAVVVYRCEPRSGPASAMALRFSPDRQIHEFEAPPAHRLRRGLWGVTRLAAGDPAPRLLRTLEDSPFYVRSLIDTTVAGEQLVMMHESFSGDRFASPIVKAMLPVRMPRNTRGG